MRVPEGDSGGRSDLRPQLEFISGPWSSCGSTWTSSVRNSRPIVGARRSFRRWVRRSRSPASPAGSKSYPAPGPRSKPRRPAFPRPVGAKMRTTAGLTRRSHRALGPEDEAGVVVFRPGMTMEDLEREAIRTALDRVRGNRRKASENARDRRANPLSEDPKVRSGIGAPPRKKLRSRVPLPRRGRAPWPARRGSRRGSVPSLRCASPGTPPRDRAPGRCLG